MTRTVAGSNGQRLYARVRARDAVGNVGNWSQSSDGILIDTVAPTIPGRPTDIGAYTTSTSVRFNWTAATDSGSGVAFYELQVGTAPGATNIFNGNVGNVLTRTVTGSNGQTLYARVRASDGATNRSSWSANSDGIKIDTSRPRLTGATAADYQTVYVTFSEAVVGADQTANYSCTGLLIIKEASRVTTDTQYRLYRLKTSDQRPGATYTLTARSAAEFQLLGTMPIADRAGNPLDPTSSSMVFRSGAGPPAAPSVLTGTVISASQINLSWKDNASDEDGFKIERRVAFGGSWVQIATVGPNVIKYEDKGLSPGSRYSYRVCAYNGAGKSSYSNPWPNDKFIIVAGGGNFVGNPIVSQTQALADRVFLTCTRDRGYTPAEIYYLSAFNDWQTRDSNQDGLRDADTSATLDNFWRVIDQWSSGTARLFVYLVDHGSQNWNTQTREYDYFFQLNTTQYIPARELDDHLDNLQDATNCDIILIVDCCYAGGFVQQCRVPAGKRRIVIAATTPNNEACFSGGPTGPVSFSFYFFSFASLGSTLKDCFYWTWLVFQAIGNPAGQVPWLDDNGTGTSDKSDGELAKEQVLGRWRAFGPDVPTIVDVATTQTVACNQRVTLWARFHEAAKPTEVWAIVVKKGETYVAGQPVTDLTRVNLAPTATPNLWQVSWTPGTEHVGENIVTYFAVKGDALGQPVSSGLRVVGVGPAAVRIPWRSFK